MIIVDKVKKVIEGQQHRFRDQSIRFSHVLVALICIWASYCAIWGSVKAEDASIKTVFSSVSEGYSFEIKRHRLQVKISKNPPVLLSGSEELFRDVLTMEFTEIRPIINYYQGVLKSRGEIFTFRIFTAGDGEDEVFGDVVLFAETLYLISPFPGEQGYMLCEFIIDFKNKTVTPQKSTSLDRQERIGIYPVGFFGSSGKLLIADSDNVFIAIPERKPPGVVLYKKVPSKIANTPGKFERVDSVK